MTDIKLNQQDKDDLLNFLDIYANKISADDINEIKKKLSKKISFLKKKKLFQVM